MIRIQPPMPTPTYFKLHFILLRFHGFLVPYHNELLVQSILCATLVNESKHQSDHVLERKCLVNNLWPSDYSLSSVGWLRWNLIWFSTVECQNSVSRWPEANITDLAGILSNWDALCRVGVTVTTPSLVGLCGEHGLRNWLLYPNDNLFKYLLDSQDCDQKSLLSC